MPVLRAPSNLKTAGRGLWRNVTEAFELRDDEQAALEAACRTLDELRRLEAELKDAPVMIAGSKGQDRVHPLFAEVRSHRLALRTLLAAVGLLDVADPHGLGVTVGADPATARSAAGRSLARQRWGNRG